MNGILNIFKPAGISSNGVIKEIKRLTGEKKIGHIGTLDPLASGVLPLFLGKYTKLIPYCNQDYKVYRTVARLGAVSDTLDAEGELTPVPIPESCTLEAVKCCLESFIGQSEQIPPMFSAVKIEGKRLYQYARVGQTVQRTPRLITIFNLRLLRWQCPELHFEVTCSKGTYIRTLADDIAIKLGTRAYLKELTRLAHGRFFTQENALGLEQAKKMDKTDLQKNFIHPQYILSDWHKIEIDSAILLKHICQGRAVVVPLDNIRFSRLERQFSKALVFSQSGEPIATGNLEFSQDTDSTFSPEKVFL